MPRNLPVWRPALRSYETAEGFQIRNILVQVVGFGGFEAAGAFAQAGIVDDVAEADHPDLAFADVFMAVDARTEVGPGIVQVKGDDLLEADEVVDFLQGCVPTFGRANVVSGGEEMAGVEADGQAFGVLHAIIDRGEMFHAMAQTAPLPCRVLERDAHFGLARGCERFVESCDGALDADLLAGAHVRAGMHHQKRQTEGSREADFLRQ